MDLNNKRVLVVGLGKSGVASALFLKSRGARVTVSDTKPEAEFAQRNSASAGARGTVETGGHGDRTFRGQDLIVVSPGVPVDAPQLVQARTLGEAVIGEIELAAQFLPGPSSLLPELTARPRRPRWPEKFLRRANFRPLVVAISALRRSLWSIRRGRATSTVLEVSSFQLETIRNSVPGSR